MRCPGCQRDNEPGAKFCEECAEPLARTCSKCGHQLSSTAKFCPECAHPTGLPSSAVGAERFGSPGSYTPQHLAERILTSRIPLEGERKQVTVLFADMRGSTELIADRDPEEASRILDPVIERMIEAVHFFEGTVSRVMGDGIMALFGAPLAHEDHAVRACYAALQMQDAVKRYAQEARGTYGVAVQIRVGLNSGEVVVRAISTDLHMDYDVVGETVHLASRMEQLADPGAVLLTPATLALAEDFVQVRSLGPVPVKGLSQHVTVYELISASAIRSRVHAHASRGLARFVGRTSEMAQLVEALDLARQGHGQLVGVVGEPGVGKSRLFWEFVHSDRVNDCLVIEAASVSYGRAATCLPVIELLRGYFFIEARDDTQKILEKVTAKLFSLDRAMEDTLPALLALLDVPVEDEIWKQLDPPGRRQRTLEAIKRLILRESQVQPLVIVFEDLHWIDGETQAVLDGLVESMPTAKLLLLVNYRPEYQNAWVSKTYFRMLRIDPLPVISAEELLRALVGDDPALNPLRQLLITRTEGNPFFLEESVRTLVETNVLVGEPGAYRLTRTPENVQIPATAQAILATRIDRLEPEDKRLLQTASVVGKDVPFALLEAIAETPQARLREGLARLQAAEFLYVTELYPDTEYTFKHALTHEVTYAGLLLGRRCKLHAQIVGAIEKLHSERVDEHIVRLAHHAVRGQLQEKAVHYLRLAGLRAATRSALQDARVWFEQALGILKALPESQSVLDQAVEIRLQLWPVLIQLGEVRAQLRHLQEAEVVVERLDDDRRRGRVFASMTNVRSLLGELDDAILYGSSALAIADRLGDLGLRILTTTYLEQAHYLRGEYQRVIELAISNLAALPADRIYEYTGNAAPVSVFDRRWMVMSLAELGRFVEAEAHAAEAITLAEPTQHAFTNGVALGAAGALQLIKGDWGKARPLLEQAITALRGGNVFLLVPHMLASSAWALTRLGEFTEALNRLEESEELVEAWRARGIVGETSWVYSLLGHAALALGLLDEARRLGDRAVGLAQSHPGFAAQALHLLGEIPLRSDRFDPEMGEERYRNALALAEPRGMRPLMAHCHLGLGRLCLRTDKRHAALEHLDKAMTMYYQMGMPYWLARAEAEIKLARITD